MDEFCIRWWPFSIFMKIFAEENSRVVEEFVMKIAFVR